MGLRAAAWIAGLKPKITPTAAEKVVAMTTDTSETFVAQGS